MQYSNNHAICNRNVNMPSFYIKYIIFYNFHTDCAIPSIPAWSLQKGSSSLIFNRLIIFTEVCQCVSTRTEVMLIQLWEYILMESYSILRGGGGGCLLRIAKIAEDTEILQDLEELRMSGLWGGEEYKYKCEKSINRLAYRKW